MRKERDMALQYSGSKRIVTVVSVLMMVLMGGEGGAEAWGEDGHYLVCSIAQTMFRNDTVKAVNSLIPSGELADWCSWADQIRSHYSWSAPLHFINTPQVCNYDYQRDCNYEGVEGVCVAGAINNYTSQLIDYSSSSGSTYNSTEALFFLAHFIGDIHQPLHVSFSEDKGGNTIYVHWFGTTYNLHSIWDTQIIRHAVTTLYDSDLQAFQDDIMKNITDANIQEWSKCTNDQLVCPNKYASESLYDACRWAYEDAPSGSYLAESYFNSRLPIVENRIARAGVRLASVLNNIFSSLNDVL